MISDRHKVLKFHRRTIPDGQSQRMRFARLPRFNPYKRMVVLPMVAAILSFISSPLLDPTGVSAEGG